MEAPRPVAKPGQVQVQEGKHPETEKEKPQALPGLEKDMRNQPRYKGEWYRGSAKLEGKVSLITGGDSGIGRSIAVFFAREGCDVAINYLPIEEEDAKITKAAVEQEGRKCLLLPGNLRDPDVCKKIVEDTVKAFNRLDILVNNAATQVAKESLQEISDTQLRSTFETNIVSMFLTTRAALDHLPKNTGSIINTSSVVAFKGHPMLLDYATTKGAIVAFTRSLAVNLAKDGIRVNCVAPGPIWTPLIPSSFPKEHLESWGQNTPMGRAGEPEEVAPSYVFLASKDASFITGQCMHINGGELTV